MLTLRPLRSAIIGLGLFAAATSAQAQLLITFQEDTEKGHLSVIFSGQVTAPFDATTAYPTDLAGLSITYAYVLSGSTGTAFFSQASGWTDGDQLLLMAAYNDPIDAIGSGGFLMNGSRLQIVTTTSAIAGEQIVWDGTITYVGDLAGIRLEEGDFGTLVFTNSDNGETFEIHWDTAVVPEPATYALALGLGVAGVALLRRRSRR